MIHPERPHVQYLTDKFCTFNTRQQSSICVDADLAQGLWGCMLIAVCLAVRSLVDLFGGRSLKKYGKTILLRDLFYFNLCLSTNLYFHHNHYYAIQILITQHCRYVGSILLYCIIILSLGWLCIYWCMRLLTLVLSIVKCRIGWASLLIKFPTTLYMELSLTSNAWGVPGVGGGETSVLGFVYAKSCT